MEKTIIIEGREASSKDIEFIREMIKLNPSWSHTRLSKELVLLWNWRTLSGQLKNMACRIFLLKLERRAYLRLPPRLYSYCKVRRRLPCPSVSHQTTNISD